MVGGATGPQIALSQGEVWTVSAGFDVMNVQSSAALAAEQGAYGAAVAVALEDLEAKVTPLPAVQERIRHRVSQLNCIQSARTGNDLHELVAD